MADSYNILIETKAKLDEIQTLLEELRAINAEISKINGQTFSAVSSSTGELSSTSKALAEALQNQSKAFAESTKASNLLGEKLKETGTNTVDFTKEINQAQSVTSGFYMELGAMASRMAVKLPSAIAATIKAFGEQEVAVNKLRAAVKNSGGSVSELMPVMETLASEMQKITTFGDEQVLAMQSLATSMGVTSDQMKTVIQDAIGLSTALGLDVMTATKAASAAIQGKTTALRSYIPQLNQCKTAEESLAQVQKLANSGFAQAQAQADTLSGRLTQTVNAWGDLQEVMGETFAPTIKIVASLAKNLCEILAEQKVATKLLTSALTGCAVAFAFAKVGGLLNVSKMLLGVASATNTATAAIHGLNVATKANPIGLIAGVATTAIVALISFADSLAKTADEEDKLIEKTEQARQKILKHKESIKEASALEEEYAQKIRLENETIAQTAARISELTQKISELEKAKKNADDEKRVELTKEHILAQEELNEAQKKYTQLLQKSVEDELQSASINNARLKMDAEQKLANARAESDRESGKFQAQYAAYGEKIINLEKQYIEAHKDSISNEEEKNRLMQDAYNYAKNIVNASAEMERFEKSIGEAKSEQKTTELEILRARASGNEVLAKEKEQALRISQLTFEIFENSRKENMSVDELKNAMERAGEQARERYELERSITDETQRQNLAKNAQAKVEDILMANAIERLKAEGRIAEAKELENEREIRRTLAGLEGVSEKDKESLAKTMRQTNAYREKSENDGGKGSSNRTDSRIGTSGRTRGATPPRRAATVSDKTAPYYDEWKAQGGGKNGLSLQDFISSKQKQEANPNKSAQAGARNVLSSIENQSQTIASRISLGGDLETSAATISKTQKLPQIKTDDSSDAPESKTAQALNQRGVNPQQTKNPYMEKVLQKMDSIISNTAPSPSVPSTDI